MSDELQDSAADARRWVMANPRLVNETYQRFLNTGEWPGVAELQRHFDQRDEDIDVQEAIDAKPRVINEARLAHTDRLVLQLRHLMWVNSAKSLIDICVTAIQHAVNSYFSEEPEPSVSSEDNLTNFPSDRSGGLTLRAYSVLSHEYPSPFGGSTMQGETWRIQVDSRFARRFKDIEAIEDFVARQDAIRIETAREAAAVTALEPPVDFYGRMANIPVYGETDNAEQENSGVGNPTLFLSWGRTASKAVAAELKPMLQERLPGVEIFFSPTSIEPGSDPSRRMFDEGLLVSSALVVVLTEESADSAYVIWETATAWARDQLVIPIFVDIEPDAVPGPLTNKVQGVHLGDKDDLGRALQSLATRFGVPPATPLTIQEHEALLQAAQTPDNRDVEDERRSLNNQLRGYVARWQILIDGLEGSPSVEERVDLAAEIQQVLTEAVRRAITSSEDSVLATELSKTAKEAAAVKRIQVYLDGGQSLRTLDDGCRNLIQAVSTAVGLGPVEPSAGTIA